MSFSDLFIIAGFLSIFWAIFEEGFSKSPPNQSLVKVAWCLFLLAALVLFSKIKEQDHYWEKHKSLQFDPPAQGVNHRQYWHSTDPHWRNYK